MSCVRSGSCIDCGVVSGERRAQLASALNPLSAVYGQVARFRRHWYEQRPHLQRQLGCPVISVGNLVVGGSGKTPVVATLAGLLRDAGYAPAILSRGYKRRGSSNLVIVSDGQDVLAAVEASGDEPQMLARRLPTVPVVVSPDRYRAGTVARQRLGANVMILDDGFQHVQLARTVNLLLLSSEDLEQRVLPVGRLREPLDAAGRADAVLVPADTADPSSIASHVGVKRAFRVSLLCEPLRMVRPFGAMVSVQPARVVTLAAIARPERFVNGVRALGYDVQREFTFRDHHWFTAADLRKVEEAARVSGAGAIVTTEKDAVRLEHLVTGAVPIVFLPIEAHVEPTDAFRSWLLQRVGAPGASQ